MNNEQLIQRLRHQGSDAAANMMKATGIRPLDMRDIQDSPDRSPLSDEDCDNLIG